MLLAQRCLTRKPALWAADYQPKSKVKQKTVPNGRLCCYAFERLGRFLSSGYSNHSQQAGAEEPGGGRDWNMLRLQIYDRSTTAAPKRAGEIDSHGMRIKCNV